MPENLPPHRFRVPREDRSLLSIPDLEMASGLVEENRKLFAAARCFFHGRSLLELRSAARQAAVTAACDYTASLLQLPLSQPPADSCLFSGHQPELFHVGVWAKNFTLAGIARQTQSVPVNLVIDNDTLNATSLKIPVGTRDRMRIERIPFDKPRPPIPWEEAKVLDRDLFQGFGREIGQQLRETWGFNPLIEHAWTSATKALDRTGRLCDGLTGFRAQVERNWGLNNLELPMSRLCETEPFLWFFAHLIYNEAVAEYRIEHRLRNRMQPVPDLEAADGWLEAPFWIWQRGDTERGRLFVRRVGAVCELRYGDNHFARLPYTEQGPLDDAVNILSALPAQGLRLRTRALTTTLFARTCLSDLFVHGIGGAKYDAMTDRICERFLGLKAPAFLTVSATLYLPLGNPFDTTETQLREINHRLRDLTYNPDRHLNDLKDAASLIAEKNQLLAAARELREANQLRGRLTPDQHRRLTEIRAALQQQSQSIRNEYESLRSQIRSQLATNTHVRNREYAFAFYPEEPLRQFLTPLSDGSAMKKT